MASEVLPVLAVEVAAEVPGQALVAVVERLASAFGSHLPFLGWSPSRLLELAVVALVFVIALQLREIKHQAKS